VTVGTDEKLLGYYSALAEGRSRNEAFEAFLGPAKPLEPEPLHATGALSSAAFCHWLAKGEAFEFPTGQKSDLVANASGQQLIPADITVDILDVARRGVFRSLTAVRPTNRIKQTAGLLTAASVGWGRLETGTVATAANIAAQSAAQTVEVHDVLALARIGQDELTDVPESARAAAVDAIGSAVLDAEDTAFAVGAAADRPKGIVNATNLARIPAANKIAASASNTPTWVQLSSLLWLLADRYRDNGVWIMHRTAAAKVAALAEAEATNF
jgi:HK97 family phage major capsid protein